MFQRLAHVCLIVTDLQRSLAFYEKLGLSVKFRFTREGKPFGAYLELAPHQYLEFFEEPERAPVVNNGIAHFCLETDDMERTIAELRRRDVPFTPKKLGCDNTYQIWLEDPDGNKFEVHQYTATSTQHSGESVEADW